MKETVQFVPMYDDLDMAWKYHGEGWAKIERLAGNHGFWSWLAISPAANPQKDKKGGRG